MFRKMSLIIGVISVCLMLSGAGERFTAFADGPGPWCNCHNSSNWNGCCYSWCGNPGDPLFPADAGCLEDCFGGPMSTCISYND
jgi:hypothetical protein